MHRKIALAALAIVLMVTAFEQYVVAAETADKVEHIYVIRRKLGGQPVGSIRSFAHSALLLKTGSGAYYTLEYMGDSKVYLTKGEPKVLRSDQEKKYAVITMAGVADGKSEEFEWERQLLGKPLDGKSSPEQLQKQMQSLMKEYSVWKKEHCHTAQERLRKKLGVFD